MLVGVRKRMLAVRGMIQMEMPIASQKGRAIETCQQGKRGDRGRSCPLAKKKALKGVRQKLRRRRETNSKSRNASRWFPGEHQKEKGRICTL